ncbi:cytochrome c oxidase assembly factor Coa1 family protein [Tenacibaculum sp. IB213877]|uniref:cytochrome c oxidase assembly factor Coa1 family protein n=1 Tax=Tenacibaculum sp. IB213877 TaxID=3097351 RepID=UPI002A59D69F|nr:cytochrome c oxidase assembly factor Coa1 family protein [Tenacibaculum sp. IB213877]MDY0780627.1 cytochrome c oxidase assembly factor Coa1 family protein [Tenacibaculum sp. IB213877]
MSEQYQKNWFSRNWPWALPLGCCSGCLIFILLFVFGIGATIFGVVSKMEEISPIDDAIEIANKNEKLIELIGDNIETNGFPNGNISVNNDNGDVDFSIPIKGEKGEATLIVRGIRVNKEWVYEDLYVSIKETGEEINLLEKEKILESI